MIAEIPLQNKQSSVNPVTQAIMQWPLPPEVVTMVEKLEQDYIELHLLMAQERVIQKIRFDTLKKETESAWNQLHIAHQVIEAFRYHPE